MTTQTLTVIPLAVEPAHRYGITHRSEFVYRTGRGSYPTRIVVWSNVNRPNPRNGEFVRYGKYGKIDGGNGQYLDPGNNATDDAVSILVTPESVCIDAYGTSTGTPGSGQVYATRDGVTVNIRHGEAVVLVYPDGTGEVRTVQMTNNGHGFLAAD